MKIQFNIRLAAETVTLIDQLRHELGGMSQADLIALAVQKLARAELPRPPKKKKNKSAKALDNV